MINNKETKNVDINELVSTIPHPLKNAHKRKYYKSSSD